MTMFDKSKDFEKLKKDVALANKRIRNIESEYGEDSWAINQLYTKLRDNELVNGINKKGLVRVNKTMSNIQLKAIEKATNEFLSSKTSKLGGIKSTIKDVKDSLKATYGDLGNRLTNKEVNTLYDLVADKNKRTITEQIGASDLWATLVQAKEQKLSMNQFEELINRRSDADLNDLDAKEFLEDIYNNYVSK